ncbi:MAG: hypothetical protein ACLFTT_18405 [Candidatus Hydrogenedentota bacterium]
MRTIVTAAAGLLACCITATAQTSSYTAYENFPSPASGSFSVVGVALDDGRLALWNGDALYVQKLPNVDAFARVATGYAGDPGFMALSPNGDTLLLGPGGVGDVPYRGRLYVADVATTPDFSPASIAVENQDHFSGVFLTDTLVLLEVGKPDFAGSELQVADLSGGAKAVPRTLVANLPAGGAKNTVVEKPPFTYSGALAVDRAQGIVYAISAFGSPQELRYFAVADLIAAYNSGATLDWNTDGTLIGSAGQFQGGGIAGVTGDGYLVNTGSGSVQIIDPSLENPANASVVQLLDPAGTEGFYGAIYNAATDTITAVVEGVAFAPRDAVRSLPALGGVGLLLLAGGLALAARQKLTKPVARVD